MELIDREALLSQFTGNTSRQRIINAPTIDAVEVLRNRLAAYEDTSLEPSEIAVLQETSSKDADERVRLRNELAAYRALGTVEELAALKANTFCANGCPVEQERNEYRKLGNIGELAEKLKALEGQK